MISSTKWEKDIMAPQQHHQWVYDGDEMIKIIAICMGNKGGTRHIALCLKSWVLSKDDRLHLVYDTDAFYSALRGLMNF